MGRQYKIIFNRSLRMWQVVSELAKSQGKAGQSPRSAASSASPSALFSVGVLASVLLPGAGLLFVAQPALAQCVPGSGPNDFVCSGANTNQSITLNNAAVTTTAGLSISAITGDALKIEGLGNLSYTDTNGSPLTTTDGAALYMAAPDHSPIPDDEIDTVTINTNGVITGGKYGIFVDNIYGHGYTHVTTTATVSATSVGGEGIHVEHEEDDVILNVASVNGGARGIYVRNDGSGITSVTASGTVSASDANGAAIEVEAHTNSHEHAAKSGTCG
jgi:hypothetical protein